MKVKDPFRFAFSFQNTFAYFRRMIIYRNYINGQWQESASPKTVENINLAHISDVLGTVKLATREEARATVIAASNAFRDWRATPAPTRGRIVARASRLLEDDKENLASLLTREEGKTIAESRSELQRSINVAEFCAGEARRINGETIQSELPSNFAYTIKQPLDVVACIRRSAHPIRRYQSDGHRRPRTRLDGTRFLY